MGHKSMLRIETKKGALLNNASLQEFECIEENFSSMSAQQYQFETASTNYTDKSPMPHMMNGASDPCI